MEAKLKALKVVELKDILQRANVTIPAKANKPDLISKIASTKAAIDVFESLHGSASGGAPIMKPAAPKHVVTPAPPQASPITTANVNASELLTTSEEIDWSVTGATTSPTSKYDQNPKSSDTKFPSSKPTAAQEVGNKDIATVATSETAQVEEDEEAIKRRKRAERFGIPLVEVKKVALSQKIARPLPAAKGKSEAIRAAPLPEDPEKLKARAERFGQSQVPVSDDATIAATGKEVKGNKRLLAEEVDEEEQERRRKRAERFSMKV